MDRGLGKELLIEIRQGFIGKGTSFSRWCVENGLKRQNARLAVLGAWTGPKSKQVLRVLCDAAGVATVE